MVSENDKNPFADIPSSPTVDVHTLHSDIQSISVGGGVAMEIEDVTEMMRKRSVSQQPIESSGKIGNTIFRIIVVVLVLFITAIVVAFIVNAGFVSVPPFSFGQFFSSPNFNTSSIISAEYMLSSSTTNFDPYENIEFQQFFRIPPVVSIELMLSRQAAQTSEDLLTYSQKITSKVSLAPASVTFIELNLKKDGDKPADVLTFINLTGIQILRSNFFTDNFEPNMAAFIYRDKKGIWPGYIFKLLPGKNPNSFKEEIMSLEKSESTAGLFLNIPGAPNGPFKDAIRSGLPTREQTYSVSGAAIGYAWQGRYFVISTSIEGLEEALRRLLG